MTRRWMLVVHHDEDVQDLARETLLAKAAELRSNRPQVLRAANLKQAQEHIDQNDLDCCELIVLGAATPANRQVSVGSSTREPTMNFVKKLKVPNPRVPVVVLSSNPDAELSSFLRAYDYMGWVDFTLDSHWRDDLAIQAEGLLKGSVERPSGVLDVEIILGDNAKAWRLERSGLNKLEEGDTLTVDKVALDNLARKSERLSGEVQGPRWMDALAEIADDLGNLLFASNYQNQLFWAKFAEYRAEAGGQDQTRIRFTVSDSTYPVFVEAVKFGRQDYWMLHSPIFRRHQRHSTSRQPLFQDEASRTGPINCLIVVADPRGGILGHKTFALLRHSAQEGKALREILDRDRDTHGITTDILDLADVQGDIVEALYAKLKERDWHLVHFTGHVASLPRALLAGKTGALSEAERADLVSSMILSPSRKVALDVANFVNKLGKTQFLFMSSCRSADGYVIATAARDQIPAVLGYRWTVNDERAAAFARRFYEQLLARGRSYKSLEYAFRNARQLTHHRDVNDPTWASPVLMMQQREAA